jgi:hypothetical protein
VMQFIVKSLTGFLVLAIASTSLGQNDQHQPSTSVDQFRYQPERIESGSLYHYTKSNVDGSNPAGIYIYVASRGHLEVLKVEKDSPVLAFVTADFDWMTFSAEHLSSWHVLPDGLLRSQGSTGLRGDTFTKFIMNSEFPSSVKHYPFHVYNFDFTSLNFAFRHLVDPEKSFEFGVIDPDWKKIMSPSFKPGGTQQGIFVFKGKAEINFVGYEKYMESDCRKYRISGPGMSDKEGFIWVDRKLGHFVNFEHPTPDNPAWNSFKLELQSLKNVGEPGWRKFIDTQRETNNARFEKDDDAKVKTP